MKLNQFNILKCGKKINLNNVSFNMIINESLLDVRNKNANNLSDDEFLSLIQYDPNLYNIQNTNSEVLASTPESYSRWLLKMQKNGELKKITPEKMQKLLASFDLLKKRRTLLPNNDINFYKDIDSLKSAIENARNNLSANQKDKDAKKNQKELQTKKEPGMYMDGAVELLFNGDEWEVWTPHTYEGSKALRRGASWCTGGSTCNFYDAYTSDGILYVIINKKNNNEKYQLFVPYDKDKRPREFRDKDNDSVKFREFVWENEELLDFFLTQEAVTNVYEDLDDESIDDEWDEDDEGDIMAEYNIEYDENGVIYMMVDYDDLVQEHYYTCPEDYQTYASTGQLDELSSSHIEEWYNDVIQSVYFRDDVNWDDTDLRILWKFYCQDSQNYVSFEDFLSTLFQTEDSEPNEEISKWLTERYNEFWADSVKENITKSWFDYPIMGFIYEKLRYFDWEMPRKNDDYTMYRHQDMYEDYFPITFNDCHSVEEFYREYTHNGNLSIEQILENTSSYIRERKEDFSTNEVEFSEYSENDAQDDASNILSLFMTNQEYNNFDENEEDEEDEDEDYDEEINEVLKIARGN